MIEREIASVQGAVDRLNRSWAAIFRRLQSERTITKAGKALRGVLDERRGHYGVVEKRVGLCEQCGYLWPEAVHPDDPRLALDRFGCPACRLCTAHFIDPGSFLEKAPSPAGERAIREAGRD